MLEELEELFESQTIRPTFEYVHVILSLILFGKNEDGFGRYRLKNEALIGSGTARSLISKLKKMGFLKVSKQRKGHVLTDAGKDFLSKLKEQIPLLTEADLNILKNIIISSDEKKAFLCLVKQKANLITNGMKQRDAAIKVNGEGATCLVYEGNEFDFKLGPYAESDKDLMKIGAESQEYLKSLIQNEGIELEKNDVVIIGLGKSRQIARIACLNAALTLIE